LFGVWGFDVRTWGWKAWYAPNAGSFLACEGELRLSVVHSMLTSCIQASQVMPLCGMFFLTKGPHVGLLNMLWTFMSGLMDWYGCEI